MGSGWALVNRRAASSSSSPCSTSQRTAGSPAPQRPTRRSDRPLSQPALVRGHPPNRRTGNHSGGCTPRRTGFCTRVAMTISGLTWEAGDVQRQVTKRSGVWTPGETPSRWGGSSATAGAGLILGLRPPPPAPHLPACRGSGLHSVESWSWGATATTLAAKARTDCGGRCHLRVTGWPNCGYLQRSWLAVGATDGRRPRGLQGRGVRLGHRPTGRTVSVAGCGQGAGPWRISPRTARSGPFMRGVLGDQCRTSPGRIVRTS